MWTVAANFRRTDSPSQLAWYKGWRPPGARNDFGYDDSTIDIVVFIIIIFYSPRG